jgi:hypothetical protein
MLPGVGMIGDDKKSPFCNVLSEVTELWRNALSNAHYGAGCSCCGARPIVLNSDALEHDILHYLKSTYAGEGRRDLLDMLEKRTGKLATGFLSWLHGLSMDVDRAAVGRLYRDVAGVLRSLGDTPRL